MGQIIGGAARPKRCNLNRLSQVPTPAAGEYILVSSDNSMNAAGQGNFDCYIEGDGKTAATALELKNVETLIGVFDISSYHATGGVLAKYADLTAALNDGNNIPQSFRKGGMSVKFVQSSDNNYVQFRYILPYGGNTTAENNKFVNTANWQGVDDEPTAGSDNLVKSGGVYTKLKPIKQDVDVLHELIKATPVSQDITKTYITDKSIRNAVIKEGVVTAANFNGCFVYPLIANRTYVLTYANTVYGGTLTASLGYVRDIDNFGIGSSVDVIAMDSEVVSGYSLTLTPTENKYLVMHWHTDQTGTVWNQNACTIQEDYIDKEIPIEYDVDFLNEAFVEKTQVENDATSDYIDDYSIRNAYINVAGIIKAANFYGCFVYKLTAGRTYSFSHADTISGNSNYGAIVCVENVETLAVGSEVNIISTLSEVSDNDFSLTLTPDEDMYIAMLWHTDQTGTLWNQKCCNITETYVNREVHIDDIGDLNNLNTTNKSSVVDAINEVNSNNNNPLAGKTLALDGDSICYGAGYVGGYGKIIGERNNMTVQNIAVGGATLAAETYAGETPRHWICRNVENLRQDADFIIWEGGVNDGEALGNAPTKYFTGPFDDTTFTGALESLFMKAYKRFAGKKLGFIITGGWTDGWRFGASERVDRIEEVCYKWGIPCLNLQKLSPAFGNINANSELNTFAATYTLNGDGEHPNQLGYEKFYCDKIEAWLKTL